MEEYSSKRKYEQKDYFNITPKKELHNNHSDYTNYKRENKEHKFYEKERDFKYSKEEIVINGDSDSNNDSQEDLDYIEKDKNNKNKVKRSAFDSGEYEYEYEYEKNSDSDSDNNDNRNNDNNNNNDKVNLKKRRDGDFEIIESKSKSKSKKNQTILKTQNTQHQQNKKNKKNGENENKKQLAKKNSKIINNNDDEISIIKDLEEQRQSLEQKLEFPIEIYLTIASHCDFVTLITLTRTCKEWNKFLKLDSHKGIDLWSWLLKRDFDIALKHMEYCFHHHPVGKITGRKSFQSMSCYEKYFWCFLWSQGFNVHSGSNSEFLNNLGENDFSRSLSFMEMNQKSLGCNVQLVPLQLFHLKSQSSPLFGKLITLLECCKSEFEAKTKISKLEERKKYTDSFVQPCVGILERPNSEYPKFVLWKEKVNRDACIISHSKEIISDSKDDSIADPIPLLSCVYHWKDKQIFSNTSRFRTVVISQEKFSLAKKANCLSLIRYISPVSEINFLIKDEKDNLVYCISSENGKTRFVSFGEIKSVNPIPLYSVFPNEKSVELIDLTKSDPQKDSLASELVWHRDEKKKKNAKKKKGSMFQMKNLASLILFNGNGNGNGKKLQK